MTKSLQHMSTVRVFSKALIKLCLLGLAFAAPSSIWATHIVGGDLTYRCIGNDRYEVTLMVYRDCNFGNPEAIFDDPASIGIFDSEGNLQIHLGSPENLGTLGQILVKFNPDDTIRVQSDCFMDGDEGVCVHRTVYKDTVRLPFLKGGYQLVYQRCCRNETLTNINQPLETGASFVATVSEEALMSCNSAPVFREWPPIFICVDQQLSYDHSATDADGDSLVYSLCNPFMGASKAFPIPQPPSKPPYPLVEYNDPYNLENLLGGTALEIDQSGRLTAVPNTIGQFLVGVCVEEYRNGNLIGTTRRDFEYNVLDCSELVITGFVVDTSLVCADVVEVQITDNSIGTTDESIWSYRVTSDNGLDITLDGPNPTFNVDGSQELTIEQMVIVSSECTVSKSQTLTIDVKDTGVSDGDTIRVCAGSSVVLGAGDPNDCYTYSWTPTESLDDPNIANPIAMPEMSTTYTVLISDPVNNCRITKTVHVEIIPVTDVIADFRVEKDCGTQTIRFINESTGGDTFIWEFGDPRFPDSISMERDPVHTYPPEGGTFIAVLTIPGDECNAVRTKRLPVTGTDFVDGFSDTIEVCGPSFVELNPDRNPLYIYEWEDNPLIPDRTAANPDIFLADDATFQVTITDPLNMDCVISGEVVVIVDSQLVVDIDTSLFVCEPGPVELNPGGDPDLIYEWSPIFDLDDPTSHNPTANVIEEIVYIVLITDPNDATCTIRWRVRVSIGLDDTGGFGEMDTLFICDSSSFFLNPGANPNLVYQWSPTEGLDDPTSPNPIASPTESTTYSVTITDSSGTCSLTKIGHIEIVMSDVLADFRIEKECGSLTVQFLNTSVNAESFEWTFGDPTNPNFVSTEESPSYTYPMGNATYEVELRATDDPNCTAIRAMRITLTGDDFVDFSDTIRLCGPSLVYLNPDRNPNYDYCWEAHPAIADTNAANPRVDLEDTTIFKLIVKDPLNDTCTIMGEVVVLVDDQINPNLPDTVINCVPGPIELSPGADPTLIYMWEPADLLDDPTSFNPTAEVEGSAVFSVTVTDPNDSTCMVQAEVNVFIGDNIPLITTDSMNMLCPGDSVTLSANSGLVDSLIWTDPDGIVLGTGSPLDIAVEKSGYYKVTGIKDNCEYMDSVFLGVRELMFSLDKELPVCPEEPVEITVTNNTDFVIDSIIWKPDDLIALGQGSETVVVRPEQTATIIAMVIFEDGCMMQDSVVITVSDLDRFNAFADPDTILFGESTTLIATQEEGATYQWTPSDIVQNPTSSSTVATPPQSTTFTVDITDMSGCSTSIEVPVEVIMIMCEPPTIFLPNAFSPNGDGTNDIWQIRHPEINRDYIIEMDLFVYNRWGQLVFESHSPENGWDGTFKGELLGPDVFGYYLRIVCVDGDSFSDKGNVSLLH